MELKFISEKSSNDYDFDMLVQDYMKFAEVKNLSEKRTSKDINSIVESYLFEKNKFSKNVNIFMKKANIKIAQVAGTSKPAKDPANSTATKSPTTAPATPVATPVAAPACPMTGCAGPRRRAGWHSLLISPARRQGCLKLPMQIAWLANLPANGSMFMVLPVWTRRANAIFPLSMP